MTQLTGSTRRSDWVRRWGHELPRDWEKGHIHVDGDGAWGKVQGWATLAIIALASGLFVLLVWGSR